MPAATHKDEGNQPERTPLHAARTARGLTAQELAHLAGLNQNTVYRLEKGRGRPRRSTRILLAAILNTDQARLFPDSYRGPQ